MRSCHRKICVNSLLEKWITPKEYVKEEGDI